MNLDELAQYLTDGGVGAVAVTDVGGGNYAITVGLPITDAVLMVSANAAARQQIGPTTEFEDGFGVMFYGSVPGVQVPPDCVVYLCERFTRYGEVEADEAIATIGRLLADLPVSA